jgi:lipopolysaccharide transport system permease protein
MIKFQDIIIEPKSIEKNYWKDIWNYRDLIYILTWRDIKVRYKQTFLGIAWALIKPLFTMIIFVVVFGQIAGMNKGIKTPYPLIVIAGLIPWQFFSNAFLSVSESLITNSNLLTKVYFPRLIIPISAVLTSIVDYIISYVILIVLLFYYNNSLDYNVFFIFFYTALIFLLALGSGLFFATLNVKYRDFRYIIPFIIQIGIYITPIGFLTNAVPEKLVTFVYINPLTSIIDGFRFSFFSDKMTNPFNLNLIYSISFTLIMLFLSIKNFRKFEKTFADII